MTEETLFQEALSLPPEERAAFLARVWAGRPELLAGIEALLAAHEKTGNLLDDPPPDLAATIATSGGEARAPATAEFTPTPDPAHSRPGDSRAQIKPGLVIGGRY